MTIQIKDVVIKTSRLIYAEILPSSKIVRIYLEGLPQGSNCICIYTENYEEGKKLLEEINDKMNKRG